MLYIAAAIVIYSLVHFWTHVRPRRAFAQGVLQVPTTQDGEAMSVSFTLFEDEDDEKKFDKIQKAGRMLSYRIEQNNKIMLKIQEEAKKHHEEKKAQKESKVTNIK